MISSQQIQEEISDLEKRRDAIDQEIIAFRTLLALRQPNLRSNDEQKTEPFRRRIRRAQPTEEVKESEEVVRPTIDNPAPKSETSNEPLQYAELAREWLESYEKRRLSVRDFRSWLTQRYDEGAINKGSLGTPLRKMAEAGELRVTREGKGRAPTIYEVVEPGLNMG